jgi:protein TonB
LGFGGAALGSNTKKKPRLASDHEGYIIRKVVEPEQPKPDEPKPKEKIPVKTKPYTAPVVLKDDLVDKPLTSTDDMKDADIGTEDIEGKPSDGIESGPEQPGKETGIIEPKKDEPAETILDGVEIAAKFTGNWVNFLLKNLRADVPVDNGAPEGTYSVIIQFVVDKEGNVSEVKALTSHGYGMEEEALRVIKKSNKWEPAFQNGVKVKAYCRQVITFQVVE